MKPLSSSSPGVTRSPDSVFPSASPLPAVEPETLRRALAQAQAELAEARRLAEEARAEQDRFLSSLSHELRTPLSAILLWTSLLEEQKLSDPAQLREAVDAIRHSAEEQQALVQNLVDTARILSGRLRLELLPTAIDAVIRTALENVQASAQEKQIALDPPPSAEDLRVDVDRERLQQALGLLLSNAIKFTPAGGRVSVAVRAVGAEVLVDVHDTGIGIASERLPHLFDGPQPTRRVAARMDAGLGFGLLVARRLSQLHHGDLSAESAGLGRGATFTVRLPRLAQ